MIRWLFLLRYPDGVSVEDGERWYLGTHTQEAKHMKGLCRYVTWKLEPPPEGMPGRPVEVLKRWARLTEVCFIDWDAWKAAVIDHPLSFTPAPWADPAKVQKGTSASFVAETMFLGDAPEFDFLSVVPAVDHSKLAKGA